MRKKFLPENGNQKKENNSNPRANEKSGADLENKEEYAKNLEKSFLTDLDSQIELESQIIEEAAKRNNNDHFRQSLLELRKSGEEFLKNISATTVKMFNSNKLVVKLRDIYIEKRSIKINEELSVGNELARPEDYDDFLRMVGSDFWGTSNNAGDAIFRADKALQTIIERFPRKSDEVLKVWPKLFKGNIERDYYGFNTYLNDCKNKFYAIPEGEDREDFIKKSNDFAALKCLATYSYDNKFFSEETTKRIDSIISQYGGLELIPSGISDMILQFAIRYPEKILDDSRRVNFIFKLWKSALPNNYDRNTSSFIVPIIANRLRTCSPEESKQIVELAYHGSRITTDFNWVLNIIPLDKETLKLAQKNDTENKIIALRKNQTLNFEPENNNFYQELIENAKKLSKNNEVVFISNLIVNYPNKKLGIGEDELTKILDTMFGPDPDFNNYNNSRFDLDIIHALAELMNRYSWPDSLKKRIFSVSNIDGKTLAKIVNDQEEEKYSWIKKESLLMDQLQLSFHRKAQSNDLRHYFYEVLDNKKKSNNIDDLIKSYGNSDNSFDFEEIRSLFLDKKIGQEYIPYFINRIYVNDFVASLDSSDLPTSDQVWLLESILKYGKADGATRVFRRLKALGALDDPKKRLAAIDFFTDNILLQCDFSNNQDGKKIKTESEELRRISSDILGKGMEDFFSKDELELFGKKVLNGSLDFSSASRAGLLVLDNNPEKIKYFFPDDNERKDYLIKIFDKLIGDSTSETSHYLVIRAYFHNQELLSVLSDTERLDLENKILNSSLLNYSEALLDALDSMNERQQEAFISLFEKTNFTDNRVNHILCHRLINRNNFSKHPSIFKRAYLHMLQTPILDSDSASALFQKDIVLNDDDLRNTFFANLVRWPEINGTDILESLAESKANNGPSLNVEEVKRISSAVMKNRGLSPDFWQGYQKSDKNDPTFYLDQEIFRLGINNVGNDCLSKSGETIVSFLKSLSASEFEFSNEDAQTILKKALNKYSDTERIEEFYQYDVNFMENFLLNSLNDCYDKILDADLNYSASFNSKLLDYIMLQQFSVSMIDRLFERIKKYDDSLMLTAAKEHLLKMSAGNKTIGRLALLRYDFLDIEESKSFYKEVTSSSTDNVRTQILNSIDIISSMLSNSRNLDKLEQFLDKPRPEDVKNLRRISEFIEKYNQENKGRSIAVMLFAREYLPDRDLKEVIDKVAYALRKYEEIIDKNSYKNIPEGFRASIGMEYEITSSTDEGYQELTGQSGLKTDIAQLSQAARIGSGKDAIHEIATRPTDNPYLMLLEMKLLHDIEYIDLNFDRSEKYQKGARGFHLTIGGEKGLIVDRETNFLQNAIIAACWGGVQSGENGHKVNGGRGVSLRNRDSSDSNNIAFFGEKTSSVELRSLTIDKQETLQRAVTTAFNGAIAIQAFKECFPKGSIEALNLLETEDGKKSIQTDLQAKGEKIGQVASLWIELVNKINEAKNRHNESFLDNEMLGYLDEDGAWVDAADFGGQYNKERFQSIVKNIDPTLSLEEYVKTTEINTDEFFKSFSVELSDKLIKINNLYLKPGVTASDNGERKTNVFKGDQANSLSMLKVTKIDNENLENYDDYFLKNTVFDAAGEKRQGYYCLQGGSELMFTHAVQKALLEFNRKIEKAFN